MAGTLTAAYLAPTQAVAAKKRPNTSPGCRARGQLPGKRRDLGSARPMLKAVVTEVALHMGKPQVVQEEGVWIIRVAQENGKTQEYRCASESQARQLALVLTGREKSATG